MDDTRLRGMNISYTLTLDFASNFQVLITVNPERIASVIFNDFINHATLTSLYDNDFSKLCTCFTCACA